MSKKYPGGFITNLGTVGASVYFDGTGDYLTVPANTAFNFGTGNFTIELYFYRSGIKGNAFHDIIIGNRPGSFAAGQWYLYVGPAIGGTFTFQARASSGDVTVTGGVCVENSWNHLAVVKNGTSLSLFLNGTSVGSITTSLSIGDSSSTLSLAAFNDGTFATIGYISNVRIVKGTAVYTANFTPPTQLLNVTNTSLLTCNSPAIVDQSSNAFAITTNGNAAVSSFTPFPVVNPAPTSSAYNASAPGVWTLDQAMQYIQQGVWPTANTYWIAVTGPEYGSRPNIGVDASGNIFISYLSGFASGVGFKVNPNGVFVSGVASSASAGGSLFCSINASGDYFFTNNVQYAGSPFVQIVFSKVNAAGTLQWSKEVGTTTHRESVSSARNVVSDTQGNLYVYGERIDTSFSVYALLLQKYTSAGTLTSAVTVSGPGVGITASVYSIAYAPSDNIYIAGADYSTGTESFFVAKFTTSLTSQWQRLVTGEALRPVCLVIDSSENVYVLCNASAAGNSCLFKYNSSGVLQWQRRIPLQGVGSSIAVDASGSVYGTACSPSGGITRCYVFKFNSGGQLMWSNSFRISGSNFIESNISITAKNDIILLMVQQGTNYIFPAKIPSDGTLLGTYIVGGTSITYQVDSFTPQTSTLTDASVTRTVSNQALTETTSSFITSSATSNQISSLTVINLPLPTSVDYLVVAGGGSGGNAHAGGGGAGGFRTGTGLSVTAGTTYTVTVGAGGAGKTTRGRGNSGSNSIFSTITSTGGGGGGSQEGPIGGASGGSGGGGAQTTGGAQAGGTGNTPSTSPSQGNNGGTPTTSSSEWQGAGGGGASAVGGNGSSLGAGAGGAGAVSTISGSSVTYAGGGGGGGGNSLGTGGAGGSGGGTAGAGADGTSLNATANTGGGSGGTRDLSGSGAPSGSGGSGIVILRYPDTFGSASSTTGSPTVTVSGGYRIYTWTGSGSITF